MTRRLAAFRARAPRRLAGLQIEAPAGSPCARDAAEPARRLRKPRSFGRVQAPPGASLGDGLGRLPGDGLGRALRAASRASRPRPSMRARSPRHLGRPTYRGDGGGPDSRAKAGEKSGVRPETTPAFEG